MNRTYSESERLQLITDNQRALYAYIFSLVSNRHVAEEVLQETNLVLCRKMQEFDGRGKFMTWACRIAQLQVMAAIKRSKRDRVTFMDENLLQDVAERAMENPASSSERNRSLNECMDELPFDSREMINLRYSPDGSVAAVARQVDRPADSVRVSLHRIRKRLLDCVHRKLRKGIS